MLLIDDHPIILICNKLVIEAMLPFADFVSLEHINELHTLDDGENFDLVVSDLVMDSVSPDEVFNRLVARFPSSRLAFLSALDADSDIACKVNRHGYLFVKKASPTPVIYELILSYLRQEKPAEAAVDGERTKLGAKPLTVQELTPDHIDIMEFFLAGRTVQEIAQLTGISQHTLVSRTRRVYQLLGAANQAQAIHSYLSLKRYQNFIS